MAEPQQQQMRLNRPSMSFNRPQGTPRVVAPDSELAGATEEPYKPLFNRVPIWRDSKGNLAYDMPENYNWFDSFVDRRLYAQTEGGAGYWIGGRTPTRIFYENSIGDLQGASVDDEWVGQTGNEQWVKGWANTIRSQIGISEQILIADHGETVIEDAIRSSVSSENLSAKIAFLLDGSESRRRIEQYDADSSWGGFLATKSLSAVGNYMATDPITTATTIASLGTTTLIPAVARSTFIATKLPWLSTPQNMARTFYTSYAPTVAKANFIFGPIDGALSGYAYHKGYNRDRSIIHGNNATLDENPLDDIAIGGSLGLIGGWFGYSMAMRDINRNAAIESIAQSLTTIPTEYGIDYATRYVTNHGAVLRAMRQAGIAADDPLYRRLADPQALRNAGWRGTDEVRGLAEWIKANRPSRQELTDFIDDRLVDEHNGLIDFQRAIATRIREIEARSGSAAVVTTTASGRRVINIDGNKAEIIDGLRNGIGGVDGTTARLRELGIEDADIDNLYRFLDSRSGIDELDFHEWVWSNRVSRTSPVTGVTERNLEFTSDVRMLIDFMKRGDVAERQIIQSYFPSANILEPNIEKILADINIARTRVDPVTGARLPRTHVLVDDVEIVPTHITTNPRTIKGIDRAVVKMNNILSKMNEFAKSYIRNGIDLTQGYPAQRIQAFIEASDKELVRQYNNLVRQVDGLVSPETLEDMRNALRQAQLRNDILRHRLLQGQTAEQLGLLNTRVHALSFDSRLIDGGLPFRARVNGAVDNTVDVSFDRQSANALSVSERFTDRLQRIGTMTRATSRTRRFTGTQYMRTLSSLNDSVEGRRGLMYMQDAVNAFTRDRGTAPTTVDELLDFLQDTNPDFSIGREGNFITIVDIDTTRGTAELIAMIPIQVRDSAGNIRDIINASNQIVGDIGAAVRDIEALIPNQQRELDNLLQTNRINREEYEAAMRGLGVGQGGYSFAVANSVVTGMRQLGPIAQGLTNLAEWVLSVPMKASFAAQGSTPSLWFKSRGINFNSRGMSALEQVMMFANLIDSPHVLRRDFGNIIDMNLFSAQQLRNNNARQANAVIKKYRELHSRHGISHQNNVNVLTAIMAPADRKPILRNNLTDIERELYDTLETFFNGFGDDIRSIVERRIGAGSIPMEGPAMSAGEFATRIVQNTISDSTMVFNRSTMIGKRGEIRTLLIRKLRERYQSQLNVFADRSSPVWQNLENSYGDLIQDAQSVADLRRVLGSIEGYDILKRIALDNLSDTEISRMTSFADFADAIARLDSARVGRTLSDQGETFVERMDRTYRFRKTKGTVRNYGSYGFANIHANDPVEPLFRELMQDQDFFQYRVQNIPELVTEFANNEGLAMRFQAQLSREFGDVNIFQILEASRDSLVRLAREAEQSGQANMVRPVEKSIERLEDRMAHALGLSFDQKETRGGFGEAGFRLHTGLIRAGVGAFWGFQTGIAEVPKAILLNMNRNGFVNGIIDLVKAIRTKEDLDDLGYALEQYTQRYALGIDNEAYAGNVLLNRPLGPLTPRGRIGAELGTTGVNLNPVNYGGKLWDMATGRLVDPTGAAARVSETGGNKALEYTGRALDIAVTATESLANNNSRLGLQQYFLATGRDMAARSGKRKITTNIGKAIRFAEEFNARRAEFDAMRSFDQRIVAFKALAKKHKLDWDLAVRMNHHGLLDITDLRLLQTAFKSKDVIPTTKIAGIEISGGGRNPYRLPNLVDELERIAAASGTESRSDAIVAKLSGFLDEEVNSAMNQATLIGANPDAGFVSRFLFQFSNYARGFQHQTILRGANDSTMAKVLAMLTPVIIGEMIYSNARRIIEGRVTGVGAEQSSEKAYEQFENRMRENPEMVIYETITRVPVLGGFQGFMLNSVVHPMLNGTSYGRDIVDASASKLHGAAYNLGEGVVGAGEWMQDSNTVLRNIPNQFENPITMTNNSSNVKLMTAYPWDFRPFRDVFDFANDLVLQNPYKNKSSEYLDFGTGRVWSMVPGIRTWQFQAGLRLYGINPITEDPRARKFEKR